MLNSTLQKTCSILIKLVVLLTNWSISEDMQLVKDKLCKKIFNVHYKKSHEGSNFT